MLYLIRSYGIGKSSILKIGFTDDLKTRSNKYFYDNPLCGGFISTREGDLMFEDIIHKYLIYLGLQFKKNGKLDEWFIDDPRVYQVFHLRREFIEKKLWINRQKIFSKFVPSSTDYKIFEYLYNKHKSEFISTKYLYDEVHQKLSKTSAKPVDLEFWDVYSKMNNISGGIKSDNPLVRQFIDNEMNVSGSFEQKMKSYCHFADNNHDLLKQINLEITDSKYFYYYSKFGTRGCSKNNYREANLLKNLKDDSKNSRLKELIHSTFKVGGRYTLKEIKTILKEIYTQIGISKTAKATDLEQYFKLSRTNITLPDKTTTNGFKLGLLQQ